MKNTIKQALQALKNNFGSSIFRDAKRFRAALLDMSLETDAKRVRFILNTAVSEMRVYPRLESALADHNIPIVVDKLVREMSSDYMIDMSAAQMVIESFVDLLGHVPETGTSPYQRGDMRTGERRKADRGAAHGEGSLVSRTAGTSPHVLPVLPQPVTPVKHIHAGGVTKFGGYDWRVLSISSGNALLITVEVLECKVPHNTFTVSWEQCNLRKYLNSDFYNAFSSYEQSCILSAHIRNVDNAKHGTSGGLDTNDKVFLLSIDEANALFKNNADRIANSEKHKIASTWWLRSPGQTAYCAALVNTDGSVNIDGVSVYSLNTMSYKLRGMSGYIHNFYNVRPAILLNYSTFTYGKRRRRTDY